MQIEDQDLLCKDEVLLFILLWKSLGENKNFVEESSKDESNDSINDLKKELILELFLSFLKQSE
jgi:hypothetical protein